MKNLNIYKLILLGVLCTTTSISAWAQPQKVELSLSKAIEIALDSNPTIKIAELEITRSEYVIKEGKSALYPTVDANLGYSRNIALPVMFLPEGALGPGSGGAMRMGFENGFQAVGTVALPVYMPSIYRNISMSKEQLALSIESARASRVNMVNEVKNAYYNIVLAKNSLDVLLENKSLVEKTVTDIENKYKAGLAAEYDLLTAQVQLQNLMPVIERAESGHRIANYMLKVLLSLPENVEVALTDDFNSIKNERTVVPTGKLDLSNNTDLRIVGHQIKLQEHQYRLSRANRMPSVFANVNFMTQSQSHDFKISHYNWAGSSLAGLSVKIPIFAGLKNKYKDIQIKNSIKQTEISRTYLEANLNTQASSIMSSIASAEAQILSNNIAIKQATKAYEITQTRFRVGSGTILELNSSQVSLMQAELNLNQSIYDLLTALSNYDKLLGKDK